MKSSQNSLGWDWGSGDGIRGGGGGKEGLHFFKSRHSEWNISSRNADVIIWPIELNTGILATLIVNENAKDALSTF